MNEQKIMNQDPQEIAKFSQHDWWDTEGSFKTLHQINPVRLSFIQSHVNLHQKKVVDLGCGAGILTEALAKCGAQCIGVDLNEVALEQAREHAASQDLAIEYRRQVIEEFADHHPEQFDIVTCMELLEHVPDPAAIIAAAAKLAKPQGLIFFSTINRTVSAYLQTIVAAEYILQWLPKGTHEYQKFIKPSELNRIAAEHSLTLIDLKGIQYQLLSKDFVLSETPNSNYLIAFRKDI